MTRETNKQKNHGRKIRKWRKTHENEKW